MNHKMLYPLAAGALLLGLLFVSFEGKLPALALQETQEPEGLSAPDEIITETLEIGETIPLTPDDLNTLPPGVWVTEIVDSVGNVGEYTSLKLDAAGYPHISYYDRSNGDLKYAYQDVTGWHIEVVKSIGNVGLHTSLALDSAGNPHISYLDATNKQLMYTYRTAAGWPDQVIDTNVAYHSNLVLDNGHPHIAYLKSTTISNLFDLRFAEKSNTWATRVVDTKVGGSCPLLFPPPGIEGSSWLSLQLDHNSLPTITYVKKVQYSYQGFTLSNCRLRLARSSGGGFTLSTLDSGYQQLPPYKNVGCYPSHTHNSTNGIVVSYQDCSGVLKCYGCGGLSETPNMGYYSSIGLDPSGYTFISHYQSSSRDLRLTYRDASGWHALALDTDGDVGKYSSLAMDSAGLPVISYYGAGKLKIAYYATNGMFLRPLNPSARGGLGTPVEFNLTLYNLTPNPDSFTLELGSHAWETLASTNPIGPVPAGATITVTLTVMVPEDATWYATDAVDVFARSVTDPSRVTNLVHITTQAYAPPTLSFYPQSLDSLQWPGQLITHTLNVSNGNGVTLTYQLQPDLNTLLLLHLDEIIPPDPPISSSVFIDSSGYSNHGACSRDRCPQTGATSRFGYGLFFDGYDDYITIPDAPSLNPQTAIAISAWINPLDWSSNRRIVQKADDQYRLNINGNSSPYPDPVPGEEVSLVFVLQGVGSLTTSPPPAVGGWHYVVGNYDGIKMQIWVDGQLSAESSASGLIGTTTAPLYIGSYHYGETFYGVIDDVAILKRALTPQEIANIYTNGFPSLFKRWLAVNPIQGGITSASTNTIQVGFNSIELLPGVYTTTIGLTSNDPLNPSSSIPVRMVVNDLQQRVFMPLMSK